MQDLLTTIAITAYISSVAVVSIVSSTVVTAARWCSVPLVIWVRPAAIAVGEKSVRCDDLWGDSASERCSLVCDRCHNAVPCHADASMELVCTNLLYCAIDSLAAILVTTSKVISRQVRGIVDGRGVDELTLIFWIQPLN